VIAFGGVCEALVRVHGHRLDCTLVKRHGGPHSAQLWVSAGEAYQPHNDTKEYAEITWETSS